ncbi:phytanoyl-CoA dioxygenase domain-containing protein 1 isoform X1 [Coccinella septempunctata]|uniref:phytanoyl-CoA dioxygenase domain-containing protein 1 isoform X1 n=1 Tax=Coccinella septempunctata TaxID=41139 RepID=UPI001D080BEA|nr:phytanoyl-CoA dioxygenase domain-containing protein 1 isoform X1 [Coccinella septempunctata]
MEFLSENIEKDGFAVIENLFTSQECEEMIKEIRQVIQTTNNATKRVIFKATAENDAPQAKEKYFLDSAHKISFFFEEGSVDEDGKLAVAEEYLALNKIGHALHALNGVFGKYTFDERIKNICRSLDLVDPKVCQSMFIFKNPRIGGEVTPHQDASYLHTSPQSLYGIWIALEDATIENGCLWFHKGSHKGPLFKRLIRNPDKSSDILTIYTGENIEFNEENYVPVSVNKGSCVVIHGKVLHFSKPNTSPISRNIYTFHVYDDHQTTFSEENWTQPTEKTPYMSVFNKN